VEQQILVAVNVLIGTMLCPTNPQHPMVVDDAVKMTSLACELLLGFTVSAVSTCTRVSCL